MVAIPSAEPEIKSRSRPLTRVSPTPKLKSDNRATMMTKIKIKLAADKCKGNNTPACRTNRIKIAINQMRFFIELHPEILNFSNPQLARQRLFEKVPWDWTGSRKFQKAF